MPFASFPRKLSIAVFLMPTVDPRIFHPCWTIYPIRIVRPIVKNALNYRETLSLVIDDIHDNNLKIQTFIGDNPKRAIVREALNHASRYACEYCSSAAVSYKSKESSEKIEKKQNVKNIQETVNYLQRLPRTSSNTCIERSIKCIKEVEKKMQEKARLTRSQLVWPHTTFFGPPRTNESTLVVVEKLANDNRLPPQTAQGIIGRSLFLDIHYFDFTNNIPVEYMHSACLGVIKRMIELTFNVGDSRVRVTNRLSLIHI